MSTPEPPGQMMPSALRISAPHPPRRGLFISFEGGDGAGKTTQIDMLREHLVRERSVSKDLILVTREPGGTPLGAQIRELVLHGEHVDERAEALLYAADRAHHIASTVRPHLSRGGLVLSDRYLDSSIAYQGAGRSLEPEQIAALSLWATGSLLPDRTILLDVPEEALGARRGLADLDRLEKEAGSFRRTVREAFLDLAAADPMRFVVIDGTGDREDVHRQILAAIDPDLSRYDPTVIPETAPPRRDEV